MSRNGKSARAFNIDLKAFGVKTMADMEIAVRKLAIDITSDVVMMTPVKTGRARANWQPSLHVPSVQITDDTDKTGSKSITAMAGVALGEFSLGDSIWLSNNLPYILRLENGHSKQAPMGMVEVTMQRYGSARLKR